MKRVMTGLFVLLLVVSIASVSWAAKLNGEIQEIQGDSYILRDSSGQQHQFQVNESTQKEGELKVGDRVEVEMDEQSGVATSIKAESGGAEGAPGGDLGAPEGQQGG